jgi:hypothetical protein
MRIIFPLLIVVFCIAFNNAAYGHGAQLLQQPSTGQVAIPTAIIAGLRGGKKSLHKSNSKTHSKISTGKVKMVQSAKYPSTDDDDDDDDDDVLDEDNIPRHNRKSSRSLHKPKSKTTKKNVKHRSLVPWASRVFPSKRKFAFVQDGLEKLAKTGSSAYKDIYRRAKVGEDELIMDVNEIMFILVMFE